MRILTSLLFLSLASCATGGGTGYSSGEIKGSGNVIKISLVRYFRVPTQKAGAPTTYEPVYRVLLSQSWTEKNGSWQDTGGSTAQEPFHRKLSPFLHENANDGKVMELYQKIMRAGFDRMPHRDLKSIKLPYFMSLRDESDVNKIMAHRILTLQRGEYKKTVYYPDLLDSNFLPRQGDPLVKIFYEAESEIHKSPVATYGVQVNTAKFRYQPRRGRR